ncbi:ImmA/IrrE family metallo-endopeptidase [Rubripirellula sp.]|nr:ImmA/IrrE family metallo-endopeptidase [Rubripirellula sp.]
MVIDLLAQGFEVPSLSRVRIASAADDLLDDYAAMLEQPVEAPVDIEDIVVNKLGLSWGFSPLQRDYGEGVHGTIWLSRREIWIDESLDPKQCPEMIWRMFFTLAHEVGHWVLHRHFFIDENGRPLVFGDEERPDMVCRSTSRRPLIERQADEFAGCLLMPQRLLLPAWEEHTGAQVPLTEDEVRARVGRLDPTRFSFVDGAMNEPPDRQRVYREAFCDSLAEKFEVSPEAMRIELETLGLLAG